MSAVRPGAVRGGSRCPSARSLGQRPGYLCPTVRGRPGAVGESGLCPAVPQGLLEGSRRGKRGAGGSQNSRQPPRARGQRALVTVPGPFLEEVARGRQEASWGRWASQTPPLLCILDKVCPSLGLTGTSSRKRAAGATTTGRPRGRPLRSLPLGLCRTRSPEAGRSVTRAGGHCAAQASLLTPCPPPPGPSFLPRHCPPAAQDGAAMPRGCRAQAGLQALVL